MSSRAAVTAPPCFGAGQSQSAQHSACSEATALPMAASFCPPPAVFIGTAAPPCASSNVFISEMASNGIFLLIRLQKLPEVGMRV